MTEVREIRISNANYVVSYNVSFRREPDGTRMTQVVIDLVDDSPVKLSGDSPSKENVFSKTFGAE